MKLASIAFSAILASTASAQKGLDPAPQRLRSRLLKEDKEDKEDKKEEPADEVILSAASSMSMSLPAEPEFIEWGATALNTLEFDVGSLSMSMPVKCDKKCQKEKLKERRDRRRALAAGSSSMSLSVDFGSWAEPELEVFGFDSFASMSLSVPAAESRRLSEADSFELSAGSSLSMSVDFDALAEPALETFGFEGFEGSMSLSIPASEETSLRRVLAADSSMSMSVDFDSWAEPGMEVFGFDTAESFSMSAP